MSVIVPESTIGLRKLTAGEGSMGLAEQQVVRPGPGEALLEVIGAGVCGTDLHIADDEFPHEPPVTMGHEVTGVVAEVGSPTDAGWLGARVASETYYSYCETCGYCRSGKPNLCLQRRSIGSRVDGGFAAWMTVPITNLWVLPDHVGRFAGALTEPLACVANCLLDPPLINAGDSVLVAGPGAMGLLAAQVARACGGQVTVVGLEQDRMRLDVAESLGINTATAGHSPPELAESYDVVCECSGSAAGAAMALELARRGGRIVQVGIFGKPVEIDLDQVLYKELDISSGNASTPRSWSRAIELLESKAVDVDPLVTEVAPLDSWERVFDAVRRGKGIKHVLTPEAI